jgi:Tol biopolymer transport system component
MTKKFSILLSSILVFSFLQMDCKDDPPPVVPPINQKDTLIVFERILADGGQPAISPDGKKIAYTFNGDIWIMDTSGLNKRQITSGSNVDILPRWNPGGIKVGFVKISSSSAPVGILSTVFSSGGSATDIPQSDKFSNTLRLRSEVHGIGAHPLWDFSPDGQNVAYHSLENDSVYIYVINIAAGETRMRQSIGRYTSDDSPCLAWSLIPNEIAFIIQELDSNNF